MDIDIKTWLVSDSRNAPPSPMTEKDRVTVVTVLTHIKKPTISQHTISSFKFKKYPSQFQGVIIVKKLKL